MLESLFDALKELFKFFNSLFATPKRQIRKVVRIYEAMSKIMATTAVQRILITKIHNSGSLIKPNTELYATVIYEDYTHPFKSVKNEYQRLPVDREFVKLLVDIMEKKRVYVS